MRRFFLLLCVGALLAPGCFCIQTPAVSCDIGPIDLFGDAYVDLDDATEDSYVYEDDSASISDFCPQPLPPDYDCTRLETSKGKKVCNDEALEALLACAGDDHDVAKCNDAIKKYDTCAECVFTGSPYGWTTVAPHALDVASCVAAIAPTDPCAVSLACPETCAQVMCSSCWGGDLHDKCLDGVLGGASWKSLPKDIDDAAVDAPDDGAATDAADADASDADASDAETGPVAPGACWTFAAKALRTCAADPRFRVCFPQSLGDVLVFTRGACRDGADWSKASVADGTGDAKLESDLFADAGSSDAGDAD